MSGSAISALPGYRVELSPERVESAEALPRDVGFQAQGVAPTSPVYISSEDRLFVRAYNSVPGAEVEVRGRLLLPEGRIFGFTQTVAPTSNGAEYDIAFPFGLPGDVNGAWLLNLLVVRSAGSFRRGQFFVQLGVFRGSGASGFRHCVLASGYVGHDLVVNWPGTGINSPLEGPGILRSVLGTNPAAGAEISETVPAGARWRLQAMRFELQTSAVVASRSVAVLVDDGASELLRVTAPNSQAASLLCRYTVAPFGSAPSSTYNILVSLPLNLFLWQGWRIRTVTSLLDAGDNFGAPMITVEEWIED